MGVVGTGIDLSHPDLRNATIDVFSVIANDPRTDDFAGHETGVVWLINRIAPRASVIVAKDRNQSYGFIASAIDACEKLRHLGVHVINLSFASPSATDGTDPLSREVNYLVEHGIIVVAAAGNGGPRLQTIASPGAAELALTVGKVNAHDVVDNRSSRGPTLDGRLKPDCVAPGVQITAAIPTAFGRGRYAMFDCTSYATPHVTGLIALLREAYPDVAPAALKWAVMRSCDAARIPFLSRASNPRWLTGAGRANGYHAYECLRNEQSK